MTGATGRIGCDLAANVAGNGLTPLIQLVSVPVFLVAWGVTTYGLSLVLSAFPTYVALSDLSFSTVAGNAMVMLEAQGRRGDVVTQGRRPLVDRHIDDRTCAVRRSLETRKVRRPAAGTLSGMKGSARTTMVTALRDLVGAGGTALERSTRGI